MAQSNYIEESDDILLSSEQKEFLKPLPLELREDTKDSMLSRTFRKDFWIKGAKELSKRAYDDFMRYQKVILQLPLCDIDLSINGGGKCIKLSEKEYMPLVEKLSDYEAKSMQHLQDSGSTDIIKKIAVLNAVGIVALLKDEQQIQANLHKVKAYNDMVFDQPKENLKIKYLLSAVTTNPIETNNFIVLLICSAYAKGYTAQESLLNYMSDYYVSKNLFLKQDDKILATKKQIQEALSSHVTEFSKQLLPFFKAHRVL